MNDSSSLNNDHIVNELRRFKPAATSLNSEQLFYQAGWNAAHLQLPSRSSRGTYASMARTFALGIASGVAATLFVSTFANIVHMSSPIHDRTGLTDQSTTQDTSRSTHVVSTGVSFDLIPDSDMPLVWRKLLHSMTTEASLHQRLSHHGPAIPSRPTTSRADLIRELMQ